jgi:hypothetical protein
VGVPELLQWQWSGYSRYHRSRANLLIHIVAVPVFLVSNVGFVVALATPSMILIALSAVVTVVSVALQGRGHRQEEVPPEPFTGAGNAALRIFLEQWVTFPRFVISGAWFRALRQITPP